jgi:phospholipase C
VPPGDTPSDEDNNTNGFVFDRYGPRVPAVVVSPLIPRNLIDHRRYDHASIPATLEACFGLPALTQRDANANNLMPLVSLASARTDALTMLPNPAASGIAGCGPASFRVKAPVAGGPITRGTDTFEGGNGPGLLYVALRMELQASSPASRTDIVSRFNGLKTRTDALAYLTHVSQVIGAKKQASS